MAQSQRRPSRPPADPAPQYPHVAAAERYMAGVLSGAIPACRWIKLACERHARDLAAGRWRWSPRAAERVCVFGERLVHIKGAKARGAPEKRRIILEPWECFVLCEIFGWLRPDGTRRYRVAYLEIPRKNGKSTLAAIILLYMFVADHEEGAEVYCGATTEHQAWEVFGPARMMALKSPDFAGHYQVIIGADRLSIVDSAAKVETVIGSPGDGASPSCGVVDEYHEHTTAEVWDTLLTGMGERLQALLLGVTTAGTNIASPCYAQREHGTKVLQQLLEDEELFVAIWTIDDTDDWTDPAVWRKANPNYSVSVREDFLEARRREAMTRPGRQAIVLCKHLNIWSRTHARWLDPIKWRACTVSGLRLLDFAGDPCWMGIDLASKDDLACLMLLFRHAEKWAAFGRYFLPEACVELPSNEHYRAWRAQGLVTVTDGEILDFDAIEATLLEFKSQFEIRAVAYDPFQATQFATRMMAQGVPMVELPVIVKNYSEPMKSLGAFVLSGELEHDGDPIMAWAASNVVAKLDKKDNIFPCKERPENKIDPIVGIISALNRALLNPGKRSVYETRGAIVLTAKGR